MSTARLLIGTVFEKLKTIPDTSVDLVLSSPPFLALRSYLPADHPTKSREIGSEATPADFLDTLLDVVEACDRVIAPHGSLCFELGDTYSGSGGAYGWDSLGARAEQDGQPSNYRRDGGWPLDKSLTGIPTLFAWSLAYGRNLLRPERLTEPWRIRNIVVWARPNPPVGALADKFRPATSYLIVACKSKSRYFDIEAVRGDPSPNTHKRTANGAASRENYGKAANDEKRGGNFSTLPMLHETAGSPPLDYWWHEDVFEQDVWEIPTSPFKGSHYATFAPKLCKKPILSMCPEKVCTVCGKPSKREIEVTHEANRNAKTIGWTDCGHDSWRNGLVLDPFAGSGTVLQVATGHGRDAIGIDIDQRNRELVERRLGMFLQAEIEIEEPLDVIG